MALPNLLSTRVGRLAAFFFLYVTEGIPLGFAATAVATQMRRQDVGPAAIGAFVATYYLPWAFKWAVGPFVDVFSSNRWGRRRGWIVGTQIFMALTLLGAVFIKLPEQLWLFTIVLLVHNTFGATQDVAIDALACNTLRDDERGLANGLMFGGAYLGQAVGGAGVLLITPYVGFQATFFLVAAAILCVTIFVALPMREVPTPAPLEAGGARLAAAGRAIRQFGEETFRSFVGTRGAFLSLFLALLPPGAMCLGLALQSNLAVELGMDDNAVGRLSGLSAILSAVFCALGGFLSDRLGRRRTLFTYIALLGLPVLWLSTVLHHYNWIMPVSVTAADRPVVPPGLLTAFWIASMVYAVFQGLMYGTRTAQFMDVTNPAVAASQFTAYMALLNLTIAYSSTWQGIAIESWGYPVTLTVDAIFGAVCLLIIPLLQKPDFSTGRIADASAVFRARGLAAGLSVLCLSWFVWNGLAHTGSALEPIAGTYFTLVFIGSAVFLLAGSPFIAAERPALARFGVALAPFLMAMHLRYYTDKLGGWLGMPPDGLLFKAYGTVVPLAAAVVLAAYALGKWESLTRTVEPAAPSLPGPGAGIPEAAPL